MRASFWIVVISVILVQHFEVASAIAPDCNALRNCTGHGSCVSQRLDDKGTLGYICSCDSLYTGEDCSEQINVQPGVRWTNVIWIALGVVGGVVCLERLYTSCRKVCKRRQSHVGFAMLESDVQSSDAVDLEEDRDHDHERGSASGTRSAEPALELHTLDDDHFGDDALDEDEHTGGRPTRR